MMMMMMMMVRGGGSGGGVGIMLISSCCWQIELCSGFGSCVGKKYLIVDFVLSYFLNSFGTEILQNSVSAREERGSERVVSLGGSSESFLLELESFQWFVEFGGPSLFVCLFVCGVGGSVL
jgi:hypothetical protein